MGGMLIGLSSTIMLLFLGRVTGISGIYSTSLSAYSSENKWRYFFIFGLLVGGVLSLPLVLNEVEAGFKKVVDFELILGGFLVGIGTTLGTGCTSGHGVCGIALLSKRSIAATCIFMLSGALTVWLKGML